ncbi:MAG TPA: CHASE2 domain-containing protein [Thermoanaerobaculia bacterium]
MTMLESVTIKRHIEIFVEKVRINADHLKRHRPYAGVVIIGLAALLTGQCERSRFIQALEMANLDAWVVSHHTDLSRDIVMIDIGDNDYKETFDRKSPLDRGKVRKLIVLIAKAGASVIAVDLDTADWTPQDLPPDWLREGIRPGHQTPTIIWARTTHEAEGGHLLLNRFAGRDDTTPIQAADETVCWGVPEVLESGGFVRAYHRNISLGATTVPSLAAAAAAAFREPRPHYETTGSVNCSILSHRFDDRASPAILRTGGRRFPRYHPPELELMGTSPSDAGTPVVTPLSDKIVILGGSFAEARDSYWTAAGKRDGIEVLATAIDSEMHKPMPLEASGLLFYIVDIVFGLIILLTGRLLPYSGSLLVVVGAIPVAAVVGSFLAFSSWSYFASFMPVLLGVFLHKLFDDWWEALKTREKGGVLRDQLDEMVDSEETLSKRKTLTTRVTRGRA